MSNAAETAEDDMTLITELSIAILCQANLDSIAAAMVTRDRIVNDSR
jgi:hypothetical protein